MSHLPAFCAFALTCLLATANALAGDFEIHVGLKVGGREVKSERTEESPSTTRTKVVDRPVVEIDRNKPVVFTWQASNGSSRKFEDVLMHFFVVEESHTGQREVPKLNKGVVYEGALTMDFKPQAKTDWQLNLKIPEPGIYLVRVETIGLAQQDGRERFAALDLVVK
jgi:hypothetical protein